MKSVNIQCIAYAPFAAPYRGKNYDLLSNPTIEAIAAKHNCKTSQVLLSWGFHKSIVEIPKTNTVSRLQENADSLKIQLDANDLQEIDNLSAGKPLLRCFDEFPISKGFSTFH